MAITTRTLLEFKDKRQYHCYPFLPKKGLWVVAAPPKSFKSTFVTQFCFSTITAGEFLGHQCESASILYLEAEMGIAAVKDKVEIMQASFGATDEQLDLLRWRFKDKKRFSLDRKGNTAGWEDLLKEIEEYPSDIIIMDTLRKFTSAEENSSTEMTRVMESLTYIQEHYGKAIILVHHAGKPSKDREKLSFDSIRGSSEIHGHGDSYTMLAKQGNDIDVRFEFRHAPDMPDFELRFAEGIFEMREPKEVKKTGTNKSAGLLPVCAV